VEKRRDAVLRIVGIERKDFVSPSLFGTACYSVDESSCTQVVRVLGTSSCTQVDVMQRELLLSKESNTVSAGNAKHHGRLVFLNFEGEAKKCRQTCH
jgi:hypothetical protein